MAATGNTYGKERSTSNDELKRYGIVRVPADSFEIGGYRYSNLADAVAEAKRGEARAAAR